MMWIDCTIAPLCAEGIRLWVLYAAGASEHVGMVPDSCRVTVRWLWTGAWQLLEFSEFIHE
jgi:hypothetical protein